MKILSLGSLNIDYVYEVDHFVRPGETLGSKKLTLFPGGKGLNQSVAAAKAGGHVIHAGAIGPDGLWLKDTLHSAGVDADRILVMNKEQTGHAIIQTIPDGENSILLFPGTNKKIPESYIDQMIAAMDPCDWVILHNEICQGDAIIRKAKAAGLHVAFTPAPMEEAVRLWPLDQTDLIFVNETEAAALQGCLDALPSEIVFTHGARGATVKSQGLEVFCPAFKAFPVDTTAAGDTFAGYYLVSRMEGKSIEESLKRANAAAALSTEAKGASSSIPALHETLARMNQH